MAYTKTDWVDGTTAITAARLNNIEDGVDDAHAEGFVDHLQINPVARPMGVTWLADGSEWGANPHGFSVERINPGHYRITKPLTGLSSTDTVILVTPRTSERIVYVLNEFNARFDVIAKDAGTLVNTDSICDCLLVYRATLAGI